MQIEYEEKMHRRYMILTMEDDGHVDNYQIHMLQENQIEGLLACKQQKIDDRNRYVYDVTGLQTLESLYAYQKMKAIDVKNLLGQVADIFAEIQSYLLKESGILLGADYIFCDMQGERFYFCCCPENETDLSEGLRTLGEYLLPRIDHADQEAVALGYHFYQKTMDGASSEELFHTLLQGESGTEEEIFQEDTERKQILDDFFAREDEEEQIHAGSLWRLILWIFLSGIFGGAMIVGGVLWGYPRAGLAAAAMFSVISILIYVKIHAVAQENAEADAEEEDFFNDWDTEEEETETLQSMYEPMKKQTNYIPKTLKEEKVSKASKVPKARKEAKIRKAREYIKTSEELRESKALKDPEAQQMNYEERAEEKALKTVLHPKARQGDEEKKSAEFSSAKSEDMSRYGKASWSRELGNQETVLLAKKPEMKNLPAEKGRLIFENMELEEVWLENSVYFIGKSQMAADILIPSPQVSRMHARLDWIRDSYQIFDLSSRNGTYVNGHKLESGERVRLKKNDIIIVGDVRMKYLI